MTASANSGSDHAKVGLIVSREVLIIPIQVELYDDVLSTLTHEALQMIQDRALKGLLLDLSQVHVLDQAMAQQLAQLLQMASLLGAKGIISGLKPGVVVTMVEWDSFWNNIETVINLDAGLELCNGQ